MITGGVDFAADPKRTALCSIDWSNGEVTVSDGAVDDDAIVELAHRAKLSGWDVPLGWPDAFVGAIGRHHVDPMPANDAASVEGGAATGVIEAGPDARRLMRYRLTDRRFVESSAGGRWPLSVSTDLIGVPALRSAALQQRLLQEGLRVDRSGVAGVVAEAYPAGALAAWGWPSRGYKGADGASIRADLVNRLADALRSLRLTDDVRQALTGSDDRLDALVCALIARAVITGRGTPPPSADLPVARREGWIHTCAVAPSMLEHTDSRGRLRR